MFKHHRFASNTNCPFVHEKELTETAGVSIYTKRDDLYGCADAPGGTALRKVEFIVPQLAEHGTTDLIVVGRHSSSYTLNLVAVTSRLGINSHCVFVDEFEPEHSLWLSQLHAAGASTYGLQGPDYVTQLVEHLQARGRKVFVSSYEGTGTIASMGGYSLMDDLLNDIFVLPDNYNKLFIYVPVDSATTLAGMICRLNEQSPKWRQAVSLVGVPVFGTVEEHQKLVASSLLTLRTMSLSNGFTELADAACGEHTVPFSTLDDYENVVGDERVAFMKNFFKSTGVYLDPVQGFHTAAAMMADAKAADTQDVYVLLNTCRASLPYFRYKQAAGE